MGDMTERNLYESIRDQLRVASIPIPSLQLETAEEKGRGNAARMRRIIAKGQETRGPYFVIGDIFHDRQHEVFCSELRIPSNSMYGEFPVVSGDNMAVLERQPQVDSNGLVHGLAYDVTAYFKRGSLA